MRKHSQPITYLPRKIPYHISKSGYFDSAQHKDGTALSWGVTSHLRVVIITVVFSAGLLLLFGSPAYASSAAADSLVSTPVPTPTPLPPLPSQPPQPPWPPNLPTPTPVPPGAPPSGSSPSMPTAMPVPPMPPEPWANPVCEGSATVSGAVVDADGNPVMDAEVFAISATHADTFSPFPGVWCGNAYSDDSGTFSISNLADGDWLFHTNPPWGDGVDKLFASAPISVTVTDGAAIELDEPIRLGPAQAFVQVVFPGVEIEWFEGSVVLDPHSGEGECSDQMHYGPHAIHESLTENGFAYFGGKESGAYCMHAEVHTDMLSAEFGTTMWIAPAPMLINIPADAELLDLGQMEYGVPTKLIAGSVVDEAGVGVPNVTFAVQKNNNGPLHDPYYSGWAVTTTDESGNFEFTVGGGVWQVELHIDQSIGYTDDIYRTVTFADDETEEVESVQFTLDTLDSSLTGRLLGADGSPLAFDEMMGMVWIEAHGIDNDFYGHGELDQDGVFAMPLMPGTYLINIYVDEWMFPGVFAPAPFEVIIEEDATVDLGDIYMNAPQVTAMITGPDGVTPISGEYYLSVPYDYNNDGAATCYAEQDNGDVLDAPVPMPEPMPVPMPVPMPMPPAYYPGYISEHFSMYGYVEAGNALQIGGLPVGDYCLQLNFHGNGNGYLPPIETTFSIVDEDALLDLGTLAAAASTKHLVGQILMPDGSGVEGMNVSAHSYSSNMGGWANAHTDAGGNFALDLSAGEWEITIDLYSSFDPMMGDPMMDPMYYDPYYGMSQQWFTDEAYKVVVFADDDAEETQNVEFTVSQANATITGMLLKPDGTPAIGISGDAHAYSEQFENSWINGYINPETASFELSVLAGEWQVGFNLYDYGYGHNSSEYVGNSELVTVSIGDSETVQQDFTLMAYDATIRGAVLNPDGTPVSYGYAWVNSFEDEPTGMYGYISRGADIVNGAFEVKVLSGIEYEIGVEVYYDPLQSGFIQPGAQRITPEPNSTTDVVMQFVEPDSAIVGTVYLTGTTEVAAYAEVSAWSTNGQHRYVSADENGAFSLGVQSGSTWYVSAWWYQNSGYVTYHTDGEVEVEISEAGESTQDLTVVAEDYYLPQAVEETFDSSVAQSITLDDGTIVEVPAGAVPVDDIDGADVRVVIAPVTANLPSSYATDAVDYGYDIQLFDNHTGEEIASELNQDIVVTYQYEDAALAEMNADEATIAPAVRATDASTWDTAENFTVNPEKNEIRMSISQASEAAVTVRPKRGQASETPGTSTMPDGDDTLIFMPLVFE